MTALPYLPKPWASVAYFLLLLAALTLFMGRSYEALRPGLLLRVVPDFYSHASNLCLSFIICLVGGYVSILFTRSLHVSAGVALGLLLANFLVEWYVPIMNVPDPTDAYYGFSGTLFPFGYLIAYARCGVLKNPDFGESRLPKSKLSGKK